MRVKKEEEENTIRNRLEHVFDRELVFIVSIFKDNALL